MSKVTNLNDYRAGKKSPSKVGGGRPLSAVQPHLAGGRRRGNYLA